MKVFSFFTFIDSMIVCYELFIMWEKNIISFLVCFSIVNVNIKRMLYPQSFMIISIYDWEMIIGEIFSLLFLLKMILWWLNLLIIEVMLFLVC